MNARIHIHDPPARAKESTLRVREVSEGGATLL